MLTTTELFVQVRREHVLEAITKLDAGATSRFGDSSKFDLLYKRRRYPPKEVSGLALEALTSKSFGPYDFKGGEHTPCFKALRRCGFVIVRKRLLDSSPKLVEVFSEILRLQTHYSSTNSEEMKKRGVLIRHVLPDMIRDHLEDIEPVFSARNYACDIEGRDGLGRKVESPWVRIFDPEMSPSATQGWYVVLHFSRDGKRVYSTLGCGATVFAKGSLVNVPDAELANQVRWARGLFPPQASASKRFADRVELEGNDLSRQFEKAIAFAKAYDLQAFDEPDFWADLITLCERLVFIYDQDRLGRAPLSEPPDVAAARQTTAELARPTQRTRRGQGWGLSQPERLAVERRAMDVAEEALGQQGFSQIEDKSRTESYDFAAIRGGIKWFIEVKGTTSPGADCFLLTEPELKFHRSHLGRTVLAIVSNIELQAIESEPVALGGQLELLDPWDPDEWEFEPTGYRAMRRSSGIVQNRTEKSAATLLATAPRRKENGGRQGEH